MRRARSNCRSLVFSYRVIVYIASLRWGWGGPEAVHCCIAAAADEKGAAALGARGAGSANERPDAESGGAFPQGWDGSLEAAVRMSYMALAGVVLKCIANHLA